MFPFTYINYAFGLTGVKTLPYVVATVIGMTGDVRIRLPRRGGGRSGERGAGSTELAIRIVGAVVAIGVTIVVSPPGDPGDPERRGRGGDRRRRRDDRS